jgi:hypothetical protein
MGGESITINGRTITRIPVDKAEALYQKAMQMIADEAAASTGTDGGLVLVQYGDRQ